MEKQELIKKLEKKFNVTTMNGNEAYPGTVIVAETTDRDTITDYYNCSQGHLEFMDTLEKPCMQLSFYFSGGNLDNVTECLAEFSDVNIAPENGDDLAGVLQWLEFKHAINKRHVGEK